MQFFNKLTQAQQLVLQAVVAMLGSALTATFTAAYQYYTQHGSVNLGNTLVFGLTTFFVLFGGALYSYVPGHVQVEVQALNDSITALRAYNSTLQQQAIPHPPTTSVSQPPSVPVQVHVHNYGVPVVPSSSVPPVSPTTPPVSSDPVVIQSPFDNVQVLTATYKPVSLVPVPMEHPPVEVAPAPLQGATVVTMVNNPSEISMDTMPRAIAHLQKQ